MHAFEHGQFTIGFHEVIEIRCLAPTILRFPIGLGRVTDPVLAAEVFHLDARIRLFQDHDNLHFAELSAFHVNLLGYFARKLYVLPVLERGSLQGRQGGNSVSGEYGFS